MTRISLLLVMFLICAYAAAQRDTSLTEEFSKLSAKERSRIAQREQDEALKDPEFQVLMKEGDRLFQQHRYDEALATFKQARFRRPYNVHPKVKIHDLEDLIRKRDETSPPSKQPDPAPSEANVPSPIALPGSERPPPVEEKKMVKSPSGEPVLQARSSGPEKSARKRDEQIASVPAGTDRPVPPTPSVRVAERLVETSDNQSDQERIYKEAGAVVVERQLLEEGRQVVYKKVSHAWGDIHFRDGTAITVHAWSEVFGDQ